MDRMGWDGMVWHGMRWDRIGMRALKIAICRHFVMRERQPPTTNRRPRRRSTKLWQIVYGVFKWPCNSNVAAFAFAAAFVAALASAFPVALTLRL